MLSPLTLVQTEARPTAVISLSIPRDEIQQVMGPAIGEVIAAVQAQGIGPSGPLFSYHFDMQPGYFHFEVGVPVSGPVTPTGRVVAGALPATTVVRTVYTGPYEGLGGAWEAFMEALEAAGHRPAPNLWETYLTDPGSTPDPAAYQTELNRPVVQGP